MKELKMSTRIVAVFLAAFLAVALGFGCFAAGWNIGQSYGYQNGYASGRNERNNLDRSVELTAAAIAGGYTLSTDYFPEIVADFVDAMNKELDAKTK